MQERRLSAAEQTTRYTGGSDSRSNLQIMKKKYFLGCILSFCKRGCIILNILQVNMIMDEVYGRMAVMSTEGFKLSGALKKVEPYMDITLESPFK